MAAAHALTDATFDEVIGASDSTALVEFWADWCGPCKALAPVLESLVDEYGGRVELYTVDTEEQPDLMVRFGVASVPTTLVFDRGVLVNRIVGARGKRHLMEELDGLVGSVS
jgi:thioredoxin 1